MVSHDSIYGYNVVCAIPKAICVAFKFILIRPFVLNLEWFGGIPDIIIDAKLSYFPGTSFSINRSRVYIPIIEFNYCILNRKDTFRTYL